MPRRGTRVVRKEFFFYLREAKRNDWDHKRPCHDRPEDFALYDRGLDDEDEYIVYDDDAGPTPEEAEEMCEGCPVLAICKEYGESTKPASGIWGGVRWVDGKPLLREEPGNNGQD